MTASEGTRGRGRPRVDYLRRELRECDVHGLTEFTRYVSASAPNAPQWTCMKCKCDAAVERRIHGTSSHHKTKPEKIRGMCPACWIELPANGECDCT